ncbi:hypothetical protein KPATCC21470_8505 [Kitasatospora purpeofusca]
MQLAAWRQSTEINRAAAPAEPAHFARAFWHNGALTDRRPRRPPKSRIACGKQKLPHRQLSRRVRVDRRPGRGPRGPGRGRRRPERRRRRPDAARPRRSPLDRMGSRAALIGVLRKPP